MLKTMRRDGVDAAIAAVGQSRFAIFSGALTAYTAAATNGGVERKMLRGVASSTVTDLHGDRMTESAISKMDASAKKNLTIFLNHSYEVPEDVAGSVTNSWTTRGVDDETGKDMVLLHFEIAISDQNERAVKAWSAIQGGTKLGLSIGAMIPDGGATWDKQASGYIIDDIELLETSIVGIPANPKSWVENAVKALGGRRADKAAQPVQVGAPQVTLDADSGEYTIRGQLGDIVVSRSGEAAIEESSAEPAGEPATGEPVEPDAQASSITVIQIDTGSSSEGEEDGDSSQEAPSSSEPDTGAAGTTDGADVDLTRAKELLGSTAVALKSSSEVITALSAELETTRHALADQTQRADEAEAALQQVLQGSAQLVERVKSIPLGRRAVAVDAVNSFESSVSDVYSAGALQVLAQAKKPALGR